MIARDAFSADPIRTPAGHAAPYQETERRLAPLLKRVPITRVHDATRLDWLGLPVWVAVTPLALDLTVHAGKGATPAAARISAIMEAIERVCAEDVAVARVRTETYDALAHEAGLTLDPERFELPFETEYRRDRPVSWVQGHDLITDSPAWVALDLVLSPPRDGVCTGAETNGLAAGNTITEATVHALCELIERDALAAEHFGRRYAEAQRPPPIRWVAPDSLPGEAAASAHAITARGISLQISDLSHDLGVPVLQALMIDPGFPGHEGRPTRFVGLGCDLDPARAVTRAVSEAVQAHTVMVVGARDAIERVGPHRPRGADAFIDALFTPTSTGPLAAPAGPLPDHLSGILEILLDRLRGVGIEHCVVVELTRADLGIPVVRVLVPGLAGPYGDTTRRPAERLLRTLL